jgi:hypothetical protein
LDIVIEDFASRNAHQHFLEGIGALNIIWDNCNYWYFVVFHDTIVIFHELDCYACTAKLFVTRIIYNATSAGSFFLFAQGSPKL